MKELTLDELAGNLDTADLGKWYYNTVTGEFEFVAEDGYEDYDEGDHERFDNDRFIPLPSKYDLNDYEIMEDFSVSVDDPAKRNILLTAISGKGAFRLFRHSIEKLGAEDEWYAFKNAAYREIAREWCVKHGLKYSETK